jgi:uncharacterized protein YqhQ
MGFWRQSARFHAMLQLLPALETGEETLVGGQALIEGVMMRSPHAYGIAVRRPSGEIATHCEPIERPSERRKWYGWPFVRGIATLGQAMMLGFRALKFSANVALEEEQTKQGKKLEISGWAAAANMIFSIGFFIVFYKYLPLLATEQLKHFSPALENNIVFNLVDGLIRIALFVAFIWGISRWKDIHRVFEYHGAEHKTVFAFEARQPLEPSSVQKFSTLHPRCGTSFLITVMLISMAVYTLIPITTFWGRFGIRIALLPVIASVSYEIIRFAARRRSSLFALMTAPGLWLQRITTQPPDDSQVECGIRALDEAMALEAQRGGELVIA